MRGGARVGAGRPKAEETVAVRVPVGCLDAVRDFISAYRTGVLPAQSSFGFALDWHPTSFLPDVGRQLVVWCRFKDGDPYCRFYINSDWYLKSLLCLGPYEFGMFAWAYQPELSPPSFD
ncbi:hypothetical protein [Pseudaeromonas paramecii]|uniref:Uncharacterized protein n=1 Tax=Pseudaeromonas paramecii TaxID=2138166 RepID=A0ABP8PVZ8_9GAMM